MLLKGNSPQKCINVAITCHEIVFHISVSTSSFYFQSYSEGPSDAILIVSTS